MFTVYLQSDQNYDKLFFLNEDIILWRLLLLDSWLNIRGRSLVKLNKTKALYRNSRRLNNGRQQNRKSRSMGSETALEIGDNNPMLTQNLLKRKILFHCANSIELLKCIQCASFKTHSLVQLKDHFKANHRFLELKDKIYDCENCTFQSHSKYLFERHNLLNLCMGAGRIKSEGIKESKKSQFGKDDLDCLKCNLCSFRTQFESALDDHIKMRHKSVLRKCEHCPYATKEGRHLKRHILFKHTDPDNIQWFECEQCSYKTRTKFALKQHTVNRHVHKRNHKCDNCSFETKYRSTLKDHILRKHTESNKIQWLQCAHCPHKSKTRCALRNHTDYYHGNQNLLKCDHCSYETKFKHSLKHHLMWKHTELEEIQWFQCAQCTHKSKTKSDLKKHIYNKHDEKEYLKCDHCSFETKFKHSLQYHILSRHTDVEKIQWFECAHCSYKSKKKSNLKKHIDYIHGYKSYLKCDHCLFETKFKQSLEKHILSQHTKVKKSQWLECGQCSYKSKSNFNLKKHMERKHKKNVITEEITTA